jgi:GxxExxY protein
MNENEIARTLVDLCYRIHVKFGPGLLESVYEEVLCYELKKIGWDFERQKEIKVQHDGKELGIGFRADIIVKKHVIIEIKSVENIHPVHPKQLLTYLRLTDLRLGLLVNFNVPLMKEGIRRVVNGLSEAA